MHLILNVLYDVQIVVLSLVFNMLTVHINRVNCSHKWNPSSIGLSDVTKKNIVIGMYQTLLGSINVQHSSDIFAYVYMVIATRL
jgi:hypothetical protein